MNCRKISISFLIFVLICSIILPFSSAEDETSSCSFDLFFDVPTVENDGMFDMVTMEGLTNISIQGEPCLPYKTVKVLLPQGHVFDHLEYSTSGLESVAQGVAIEEVPPCVHEIDSLTVQRKAYAESFAVEPVQVSSVNFFKGYNIASLVIYPVCYESATGTVSYYPSISFSVHTKDQGNISSLYRGIDGQYVAHEVLNPEILGTYTVTLPKKNSLAGGPFDYVIITNRALEQDFQALADWKNQRGVSTTVYTVEDILVDYGTGADLAENIRDFIIDAYNSWGIQYVLLGGDVSIIPSRGMYCAVNGGDAPEDPDSNIPCDLYYAGLEGDWDFNGNHIFGEVYSDGGTLFVEPDLTHEVFVGRAPVETSDQACNFVNKTIEYEKSGSPKVCSLLGSKLDAYTYGGDHLDELISYLPTFFSVETYYDRDGTSSTAGIIDSIDEGVTIVDSNGHGNPNGVSCIHRDDISSLNNRDYFLFYSIGCYTGSFDNRWWDINNNHVADDYDMDDCFAEQLVYSPTGAFAAIVNSRFGWYHRGSTNGPSHQFNKEFFDAVFNEQYVNIGWALADSKEDYINDATSYGVYRWIYYELNLLGDPETPLLPQADFDVSMLTSTTTPQAGEEYVLYTTVTNTGYPDAIVDELNIDFHGNDTIEIVDSGFTPMTLAFGESVTYATTISNPYSGSLYIMTNVAGTECSTGRGIDHVWSNRESVHINSLAPASTIVSMATQMTIHVNNEYSHLLSIMPAEEKDGVSELMAELDTYMSCAVSLSNSIEALQNLRMALLTIDSIDNIL